MSPGLELCKSAGYRDRALFFDPPRAGRRVARGRAAAVRRRLAEDREVALTDHSLLAGLPPRRGFGLFLRPRRRLRRLLRPCRRRRGSHRRRPWRRADVPQSCGLWRWAFRDRRRRCVLRHVSFGFNLRGGLFRWVWRRQGLLTLLPARVRILCREGLLLLHVQDVFTLTLAASDLVVPGVDVDVAAHTGVSSDWEQSLLIHESRIEQAIGRVRTSVPDDARRGVLIHDLTVDVALRCPTRYRAAGRVARLAAQAFSALATRRLPE